MLIDKSYFIGPLALPQLGQVSVVANLNNFIAWFEPEVLQYAMGYDLYKAFIDGLNVGSNETIEQRWLDLRDGCVFITQMSIKKEFRGFANATTKRSIHAGVIYSAMLKDDAVSLTGVGAASPVSENSVDSNPTLKMTTAWFELWTQVNILWELFRAHPTVYTEYQFQQINYNYFRPINQFGI